jgi:serine protease inhibitor
VANAVFGDHSFQIASQYAKYVEALEAHIDTSSESLAGDVEIINTWISDHTQGMIPNMLSEEMLAQSHVVLINTLAFKAVWENKFNSKKTIKKYGFHMTKDQTCPVGMMFLHDHHVLVYYGQGYTAARLPFATASHSMSFIAYLPDPDKSLPRLLTHLRQGAIEKDFSLTKLATFGVPKFDINTNVQILGLLKKLDFPLANDFSEMGSGSAFVDQVIHSTAITLDEEGATAVAATAVVMKRGRPMQPQNLIFDRPFAFVIVADELDLVLFAGSSWCLMKRETSIDSRDVGEISQPQTESSSTLNLNLR